MLSLICLYISILLYFISIWFIYISNNIINILDTYVEYTNVINNIIIFYSIDGITQLFFYLTTLIFSLIFLYNLTLKKNKLFYNILLLCMEFLCLIAFSVSNLLLFYISFETILIPLFITIGLNGYRNRKIHAAYLLYFYTLSGSIFFLISILIMYYYFGTSYITIFYTIPLNIQLIIWIGLFISFATKLPMCPMHIWLPEAHVESPTDISVLLAGILLKLGGYGIYKFNFSLMPQINFFIAPFIILCGLLSALYISIIMMRQIDIKKIIAYSSILHMNLSLIGFYVFEPLVLSGTILSMLAHGFVSSALFFIIGILYIRLKTKIIIYYNGLLLLYPLLALYTFIFILGNISFPLTINFISEFFILYSITLINNFFFCVSLIIILLNGCAINIWIYIKIYFGEFNNQNKKQLDISSLEYNLLFILLFHIILYGFFPNYLLTIIEMPIITHTLNQFFLLYLIN
jgi:proton-translocating NADH-quinone oxidoreductase chain M